MNSAAKKEARVGKVVAMVEGILRDIASENDTPFMTAPAMLEFLTGVQRALLRVSTERMLVSTERLLAFMNRKDKA